MDIDLEFDSCLQPGSGLAEALDAAGVDSHAPALPGEDASADVDWNAGYWPSSGSSAPSG
jgi:hypothetical protein